MWKIKKSPKKERKKEEKKEKKAQRNAMQYNRGAVLTGAMTLTVIGETANERRRFSPPKSEDEKWTLPLYWTRETEERGGGAE